MKNAADNGTQIWSCVGMKNLKMKAKDLECVNSTNYTKEQIADMKEKLRFCGAQSCGKGLRCDNDVCQCCSGEDCVTRPSRITQLYEQSL